MVTVYISQQVSQNRVLRVGRSMVLRSKDSLQTVSKSPIIDPCTSSPMIGSPTESGKN